jgi:protein TonB
MKIIKLLFVLVVVSALTFSCKSERKDASEAVDDAVEAVEDAGEAAGEAIEDGAEAVGDAAESAADAVSEGAESVAEGVEGAAKGVEEMMVAEGVKTEAMAETPVIYPGCSGATNEEIRACSKEKFIAFLKSEFNKDLAREAGLDPGDHHIETLVHIDEAGKCSALKVKSDNYKLEGEMKRLIAALPQMTPATEAGQPIPVTFVLPVDFKIE